MANQRPLWENGIPDEYAGTDSFVPTITPYPLESGNKNAAIIVFPGGGYGTRADHEREPIALWLNEIGLSSFVLDYRVAPNRHPIPLADAQRAIRWVRAHAADFNVDPARIGILGFSAGGHLAATASTFFDGGVPVATDPVERQSSRPDASILCYAVISFVDPCGPEICVKNLLGPDPEPAQRKELSTEHQVGSMTPQTFIWHTAEDQMVPVKNSLLYAEALASKGIPFSLHVYPRGAHGIGLGLDAGYSGEWKTSCAGWLAEIGFR